MKRGGTNDRGLAKILGRLYKSRRSITQSRKGGNKVKSLINLIKTSIIPALVYFTFPRTVGLKYLDIGGVILPWFIAA